MSHFINSLIAERDYQVNLLQQLTDEYAYLPQGSLCHKKSGSCSSIYYQTVNCNGNKNKIMQRCISKDKELLCAQLKRRRFIEKSIPLLSLNSNALSRCIKRYRPYDPQEICNSLSSIYSSFPLQSFSKSSNQNCLFPSCGPDNSDNKIWYPEGLKHTSVSGIKVRSKSEALIVGLLEQSKVDFQYEEPIVLSGQIFHPDFSGRRPRDHQKFYWEHWGMTGDENYLSHSIHKLEIFIQHGIVPGNNLIITCDNPDGSINVGEIKNIITAFLL